MLSLLALDVIAWVWGNWKHPMVISWEGAEADDSRVVKGTTLARRTLIVQVCLMVLILIAGDVFRDEIQQLNAFMPEGMGVGSQLWVTFVMFATWRLLLTRFVDRAPIVNTEIVAVCRVVLFAGMVLAVGLYGYVAGTVSLSTAIVFGVTAYVALFALSILIPVGLPASVPLLGVIVIGCGSSSLAAQSVSPAAARQEAIGSVKAW